MGSQKNGAKSFDPRDLSTSLLEGTIIEQDYLKSYKDYKELIERVDKVFAKIALNRFVIADSMKGIVKNLYNAYRPFIKFVISVDNTEYGLAKNAIDTAVLSAAIATSMSFSISQTYRLIESALLHDVGMFAIPEGIVDKEKSLSGDEFAHILLHPIQSYKIINKEFNCLEGVALISMQHHENWNGKGYPKGLSKTEIELEARIIAVADAFTAMVSKRPYRSALLGNEAMKNLLANNMERFDPDIVKFFVQIMGLYPIGSRVELTNGATAQVIDHWAEVSLLKPRVRMLTNASGEICISEEIVDLSQQKGLFIKKSLASSLFGNEALKTLLVNSLERFDPDIMKLFVQIMGLYPIGSWVELTDGAIAQVVNHEAEVSFLKLLVRMLTKPSGELCTSDEIVDLAKEKGLFIKKPLAPAFMFKKY